MGRRNAGGSCLGSGLAWPGATLVLVVFALLLPAAAEAAVPTAGSWAGSTGPSLTFTVGSGGGVMTEFNAPTYPVYCFNVVGGPGSGEVTTRIFYVPSIPIDAGGNFNIAYHPTDSQGQPDGELDVSGSFTSATTVSGKLNYSRNACYGGEDFTATLQTAAPGASPSPGSSPGPTSPGQGTPSSPMTTDAGPTRSITHNKHNKHKKGKKHRRRRRRHR